MKKKKFKQINKFVALLFSITISVAAAVRIIAAEIPKNKKMFFY